MDKIREGMRKFHLAGGDHGEEPEHAPHRHGDNDNDEEHHGRGGEGHHRGGRGGGRGGGGGGGGGRVGGFELGAPAVWPQPGEGQRGPGHGPPKVANLEYRGPMRFFKPDGTRHEVARDLGFSGVLDGKVVWCWGDTLMVGRDGKAMICSNDSTSIGSTKMPMKAMDTAMEGGHVCQWVPATEQEKKEGGIVRYGYGGTNIMEYAPGKGIVYYLKNDRKGGGGVIVGAGVAMVEMHEGNVPVARRVHDILWGDTDPHYGDVGCAHNKQDGHVYVFGHGPHGDKELASRTFMCRVPIEHATEIGKYEYWDNKDRTWRKRRMTRDGANGTIQLKQEHAIFGWFNMNQAAPFWSNHFNKWMLLHGDSWGYSAVHCQTADALEGPWHDHGEIAKTDPPKGDPNEKAFRYCQTGHPWVDPSGKSVLATWTRANVIWGVVITWE